MFSNAAVRRSRELNEPREFVSPNLRNCRNLTGDLDGLTGDASRLTGIASGVIGEIPPGMIGCVTGYKGIIAGMPKGRKCGTLSCKFCNPKKK
jgi:hypothetical protein